MELSIDYPTTDVDGLTLNPCIPVPNNDIPLIKDISCSVGAKSFEIDYTISVFVKHDSWSEWGEGNSVKLPIKIMQPPIQKFYP